MLQLSDHLAQHRDLIFGRTKVYDTGYPAHFWRFLLEKGWRQSDNATWLET
jgi:hypothetical protein